MKPPALSFSQRLLQLEERAVVTIGGVMKARAPVKVLVTVDGMVIGNRGQSCCGNFEWCNRSEEQGNGEDGCSGQWV